MKYFIKWLRDTFIKTPEIVTFYFGEEKNYNFINLIEIKIWRIKTRFIDGAFTTKPEENATNPEKETTIYFNFYIF